MRGDRGRGHLFCLGPNRVGRAKGQGHTQDLGVSGGPLYTARTEIVYIVSSRGRSSPFSSQTELKLWGPNACGSDRIAGLGQLFGISRAPEGSRAVCIQYT